MTWSFRLAIATALISWTSGASASTFDLTGTVLEWRTEHGLGCIDRTTP